MGVQTYIFGSTASQLPIPAFRFGKSPDSLSPRVLILGGVHGDEIEGIWGGYGLHQSFADSFDFDLSLTLVPCFNIDGMLHRERRNINKVDLNRNMATRDWTSEAATERYFPGLQSNSEPETRALVACLEVLKPNLIISLHSWKPMLNVNGDCLAEAEAIAGHTGYVIEETIGYPTPGCLGTYAGIERNMPTITYEIERGLDQASILKTHITAIRLALKVAERRRTSGVSK